MHKNYIILTYLSINVYQNGRLKINKQCDITTRNMTITMTVTMTSSTTNKMVDTNNNKSNNNTQIK